MAKLAIFLVLLCIVVTLVKKLDILVLQKNGGLNPEICGGTSNRNSDNSGTKTKQSKSFTTVVRDHNIFLLYLYITLSFYKSKVYQNIRLRFAKSLRTF